jgi:hypothetical protein
LTCKIVLEPLGCIESLDGPLAVRGDDEKPLPAEGHDAVARRARNITS